jgi:hypothetical protein
MTNPLLGSNRSRIFAAAVAFGGKGSRPVDDGAHLTLWNDRTTTVAISRPALRSPTFSSQNRRTVVCVRVNVDTLDVAAD